MLVVLGEQRHPGLCGSLWGRRKQQTSKLTVLVSVGCGSMSFFWLYNESSCDCSIAWLRILSLLHDFKCRKRHYCKKGIWVCSRWFCSHSAPVLKRRCGGSTRPESRAECPRISPWAVHRHLPPSDGLCHQENREIMSHSYSEKENQLNLFNSLGCLGVGFLCVIFFLI